MLKRNRTYAGAVCETGRSHEFSPDPIVCLRNPGFRAGFVQPLHLRIARGEIAVWAGKAGMVLNGQEQLPPLRRLTFEEIG